MIKKLTLFLIFVFYSILTNAEIMKFDIKYLGLTVVKSVFHKDNESVVITAKSTGVAKLLKSLNNKYIAKYSPADSLYLPLYYKKIINQKDYREKRLYFYNRMEKKVKLTDFYNKKNTKEYEIPENVRDFFSTLYFLRKNLSDSLEFDIDANSIFWKGKATFIKTEKIAVLDTTFITKKYEILYTRISPKKKKENSDMLTNNLVGNKKKLYLWFTADRNRIPVKAQFKVRLFSVYWYITDYSY